MSVSKSNLSAEAESFVPGNIGSTQDLSADPGGGGGLPRYVTSCYPFVRDDSNANAPAQGPPVSGHRPMGRGAGSHRMQGAQGFGGPRFGAGRGLINRPPGPAFLPQPPPFGVHFIPQQQSGPFTQFLPFGQPPPHLLPGAPHHPIPQPIAAWAGHQRHFLPPEAQHLQAPYQQMVAGDVTAAATGCKINKKSKKKKGDAGMVSIGIQNEGGINNPSGSKKKARTKTIICMDAALQTDFADEIKNYTLAEEPSSLYQKDKSNWMGQYRQDTTSESEEVDSDSGYSSPLHRRNLTSSGTHPILGVPLHQPTNGGYAQSQPQAFTSLGYTYTVPVPVTASFQSPPQQAAAAFAVHGFPPMPPPLLNNMQLGAGGVVGAPFIKQAVPPVPVPIVPPQTPSQPSTSTTQEHGRGRSLSGGSSSKSVEPTSKTDNETEDNSAITGSKKKRRHRSRHRRKNKDSGGEDDIGALSDDPSHSMHRSQSSSNVSRTSTLDNDILHFEDEDEFPNLLSAANGLVDNFANPSQAALSYSDILKSQVSPLSQESNISFSSSEHFRDSSAVSPEQKKALQNANKESKNARKRRKRRELANKAAEEELAEITIEQEVLKEIRTKHFPSGASGSGDAAPPPPPAAPAPRPSGRKSQQPLSINIADMITATLEKPAPPKVPTQSSTSVVKKPPIHPTVANLLDSSAPLKRGKERENAKPKKPSPLKKVILKEREERKRLRLYPDNVEESPDGSEVGEGATLATMDAAIPCLPMEEEACGVESDLSQDAGSTISVLSSKASSLDFNLGGTPVSADMSPISQTSPISMSPLSGSPLSSGINSPIAGNLATGGVGGGQRSAIISRIHSRRFREYCNQVLDKDIDHCCTLLLQDLVRFQDRLFHKDPIKSKSKRRIVLGLREVTKHLKLKKIRCVVISPNLERIQSKGGLDETLNNIIDMCHEQNVPLVFALGRRALGRACAKLVPVSVVGIFNYEGSEENFRRLIELTRNAQSAYMEMVNMLEKNGGQSGQASSSSSSTVTNPSISFPLFTHMGHSRTPSACSAISFTSSILSEPISENYPHSEPETDSRGYEIVKHPAAAAATSTSGIEESKAQAERSQDDLSEPRSESTNSSNLSHMGGKVTVGESLDYEADTEEDHLCVKRKNDLTNESKAEVSLNGFHEEGMVEECEDDIEDEAGGEDTVQELPHIDSIHSSVVDLSAEILSQHSSKTLDQNAEAMSTHSSKTIEGGTGGTCGGGRVTPDRSSSTRNMGSAPDLRESTGTPRESQKNRALDKERIESWVAETQKQIECLTINGTMTSDVEEVDEEEIEEDEREQDKDAGLDFSKAPLLCEKLASPTEDSNSNNLSTRSSTDSGLVDVAR